MPTTPTAPFETATQAYARRQKEARALLGQITALLDQHATKQAAQPLNWGFAGDLAEVVSQLGNTRAMLAGEDY